MFDLNKHYQWVFLFDLNTHYQWANYKKVLITEKVVSFLNLNGFFSLSQMNTRVMFFQFMVKIPNY